MGLSSQGWGVHSPVTCRDELSGPTRTCHCDSACLKSSVCVGVVHVQAKGPCGPGSVCAFASDMLQSSVSTHTYASL